MTKTLRVLGSGPLLPLAAAKPAAGGPLLPLAAAKPAAGATAAADGSSGAVASPAFRRRAGKGRPFFLLRGRDLTQPFSISPYGLV